MKSYVSILFSFISLFGFSQGLNYEYGLNDNYDQKATGVVNIGKYTYSTHQNYISNNYSSPSYLTKTDTLGQVLWTHEIVYDNNEYLIIHEIIPNENDGVYLLIETMYHCDIANYASWGIQKFDASGNHLWTKPWMEIDIFNDKFTGLTLNNSNNIYLNFSNNSSSKIYTLNTNGILMDSIEVPHFNLTKITSNSNSTFLASEQNKLHKYSATGTPLNEMSFNTTVTDFLTVNDTTYLITTDSIFSIDNNFQVISQNAVQNLSSYSHLKHHDNKLSFISHSNTAQNIITFDHDLQLLNNLQIPTVVNIDDPKDFNEHHLSIHSNFEITNSNKVIRQLDYSLNSNVNSSVNRTDIGVSNLNITQIDISDIPNVDGLYAVKIYAQALLKNYGNFPLNSCRLNHHHGPHVACGEIYYTQEFSNLNILPGDSAWIDLGLIFNHQSFYQPSVDSILRNTCVYSSHPNNLTDLNITNDEYCREITLGYVGIEEPQFHKKKELVKVVDIVGRETSIKPNILLIYIYSDGSTEKIYHTE
ncbi:hypothetical protein SAMN05216474_0980 [Lishizhenia tianjinensis]|uniref:Uncharacterized protein n=1 Tax=Lishizhenia tianjinensis TaxID=477690 RepID=A0A1I6YKS6_9FLAO|nr:hypothetical protein [Lishizhenia tianjinensis]SFT51086.1 hypothetical protein SAMN05216474_0980 [Lishizhenia tianjinensis]